MKTHSLPAIALAVAATLAFNPGAFGHGGSGGGGGRSGGGCHFGGGGWHGAGGHGWYGGGRGHGRYGGWWGGDLGYAYDDWGYGYPDDNTAAVYYPQQSYAPQSDSPQGSASLVTEVQERLARTQYYRGAVDGRIGPRTRGAIGEYQSDHYLPVTGRIDHPLLQSLGLL